MSTVEISGKTGIPRVTVHERMKKMLHAGVIRKFSVVPDYSKLGLNTTAFVLVGYVDSENSQRELAKKIGAMKEVYEVHILAGEWDLLLKVRGSSIEDIGGLVVDRIRKMDGVGRTETIPCFTTVKEEG
ncbi:Lrp/AsnC family transcriptional regulator [Candidatus Micrarchaeota archaeon]|nr:Lrp/AsnC family transcriptional regulator [Candidatus Micrarchaeota archaeon]